MNEPLADPSPFIRDELVIWKSDLRQDLCMWKDGVQLMFKLLQSLFDLR